jgi:hypothetical protein
MVGVGGYFICEFYSFVNLHRNRRYFVIKLHTWFCLSYFLKTNIKCYCIYQYCMSINSFFNTVSVSRYVLVPKCLTQVPNCPGAELSWCRNVSYRCRSVNIIRLREGKLLFFVNARHFGTGTIRHQDTSAP